MTHPSTRLIAGDDELWRWRYNFPMRLYISSAGNNNYVLAQGNVDLSVRFLSSIRTSQDKIYAALNYRE